VSTTAGLPEGRELVLRRGPGRDQPADQAPEAEVAQALRIDAGEAALHEALATFHGKPLERGNMKIRIADFGKAHFGTLSLGVRKEYERMFAVIGEAFADFDDAEIRPGDVLAFLNDNFSEHRTARRAYKARLSTFFGWAVLNGHIKVNPCREIKLKGAPKRKGKMSWEIYWKMFDALPARGQIFLELMLLSRQRPTEIRLLRESWVKPGRIRFEPSKTERSSAEYVEIARSPRIDKLLEQLRALRAAATKDRKVVPIGEDPHLFVSEDGEAYTKSGLNTLWRRGRDRAGVGKVTTRDIRPFALAQMEKAGETVEKIREAAAHTTTGQTEDYLNQHRERFSSFVMRTPRRPKT
jgi:integrase